jgi:hypothetical protein
VNGLTQRFRSWDGIEIVYEEWDGQAVADPGFADSIVAFLA